MNILNKLERKIGRFAIPNLMFLLAILQFTVYVANILFPQVGLNFWLMLDRQAILSGQVWRLISFILIPPQSSVIFIVFSLYLYYLLGTTLENQWGSFKFNVYYLIGMIGAIIACFISGYATNVYLNYSLFFAFAVLYPNYQLMLFFIIPIKIKYLALIDAAFFVYSFIVGSVSIKLSIVFSLLNFLIFFGKDFFKFIKDKIYYSKTRRNFRKTMNR